MSSIGIIIPTWDNPQYLMPCLNSLIRYTVPEDLFHIYVVNNGRPEYMEGMKDHKYITVLQQESNLGWEGGLKAGLAASKEPYVVFLNDDTHIPSHQPNWLLRMISHFSYPDVAAVGPTSNVVMGRQQLFADCDSQVLPVKFLIGFCMMVKRDVLEAAGGIDATLPGGDDLDLSIRFRKLGKRLICDRQVFIWHHGFKTGERVEGTPNQAGGWNSVEKIEKTNFALINKHGLPAFLDLWTPVENGSQEWITQNWGDTESEICKSFATGEKVAEIGCGDKKIVPNSVGIDITPKGQEIPGLKRGRLSIADVTANVEEPLPVSGFDSIVAQHVLEHMVDAVGAVTSWKNALRHGGRLIVAVPNQEIRNSIPMNWEHRHAWTPNSLKKFMETLGMKTIDVLDPKNGVSFVGVFERNGN
jgi:predicted SAM-dependent methyltransferase